MNQPTEEKTPRMLVRELYHQGMEIDNYRHNVLGHVVDYEDPLPLSDQVVAYLKQTAQIRAKIALECSTSE